MKHLFVPYDLALQLKEKGFDMPCLGYYDGDDDGVWNDEPERELLLNDHNKHGKLSAPLYQQVVDWFRENKGIHIQPQFHFHDKGYKIGKIPIGRSSYTGPYNKSYKTYYEALNKAIKEALKLI